MATPIDYVITGLLTGFVALEVAKPVRSWWSNHKAERETRKADEAPDEARSHFESALDQAGEGGAPRSAVQELEEPPALSSRETLARSLAASAETREGGVVEDPATYTPRGRPTRGKPVPRGVQDRDWRSGRVTAPEPPSRRPEPTPHRSGSTRRIPERTSGLDPALTDVRDGGAPPPGEEDRLRSQIAGGRAGSQAGGGIPDPIDAD